MHPSWHLVLWQRALQHPNVAVQRLGLRTFLQRDWGYDPSRHQDGSGSGDGGGGGGSGSAALSPPAPPRIPFPPVRFVESVLLPTLLQREAHFRPAADAPGFNTQVRRRTT